MKKFIFLTKEGATNDTRGGDTENLQVLGFGEGESVELALEDFKQQNAFVLSAGFKEVEARELKNDYEHYLSI